MGRGSPVSNTHLPPPGAGSAYAGCGGPETPLPIEEIRKRWWWVLERVRLQSPTTEALLRRARVEGLDVHDVIVTWPWGFHTRCLDDPRRREMIENVMEQVLGRRYGLRCVLVEP